MEEIFTEHDEEDAADDWFRYSHEERSELSEHAKQQHPHSLNLYHPTTGDLKWTLSLIVSTTMHVINVEMKFKKALKT